MTYKNEIWIKLSEATRESFVIFSFFDAKSGISLLDKSEGNTISLWKRDSWGLSVTDHEKVANSGGETSAVGILDVTNVVGTDMLFDGGDDTDSSNIVSSGEDGGGSVDELDDTVDFFGTEVVLDGVSDLNVWVWESDGSSVVSDNVWDLVLSNGLLDNLAELESSFLSVNSVWVVLSSGVDEDSEMLVGLLDGDDVHNSEWESEVLSDLTVNLDESLLVVGNSSGFISGKSVLESLLEENVHWDALSQLVWTSSWSGSVNSLQFTKIPGLWSGNSLNDLSLSFIALQK